MQQRPADRRQDPKDREHDGDAEHAQRESEVLPDRFQRLPRQVEQMRKAREPVIRTVRVPSSFRRATTALASGRSASWNTSRPTGCSSMATPTTVAPGTMLS